MIWYKGHINCRDRYYTILRREKCRVECDKHFWNEMLKRGEIEVSINEKGKYEIIKCLQHEPCYISFIWFPQKVTLFSIHSSDGRWMWKVGETKVLLICEIFIQA